MLQKTPLAWIHIVKLALFSYLKEHKVFFCNYEEPICLCFNPIAQVVNLLNLCFSDTKRECLIKVEENQKFTKKDVYDHEPLIDNSRKENSKTTIESSAADLPSEILDDM